MSNMTIKQMEAVVKDYIDDDFLGEYRYALMLNGNWGSGKTYFIQNNIIRSYNEDYHDNQKSIKGIYVSLNGLKDKNEITSSIMSSVASAKTGKTVLWAVGIAVGLLSDLAGKYIGAKTSENVEETLSLTSFSENEFFFVFDDLERCLMPIEESLGYISVFVEQYKAKVIILANEKEIKNNFAQRMNYYQLAANANLKISLPENERIQLSWINNSHAEKEEKIDSINLSDLTSRGEKIIETLGVYEQIKEKVIGKIVNFEPSIEDRIQNIFELYAADYLSNYSSELTAQLKSRIENYNQINFRTVCFAVEIFRKFAPYIDLYKVHSEYKYFIVNFFYIVLQISIDFKESKKVDTLEWFKEINDAQIASSKYSLSYLYKVIYNSIYNNSYPPKDIASSLDIYFNFIKELDTVNNGPLGAVAEFDSLDEERVEELIEEIYQKLCSSYYTPSVYDIILDRFNFLYNIGFQSANPQKCVSVMEKFIKEQKITHISSIVSWRGYMSDIAFPFKNEYMRQLELACNEVLQSQKDSITDIIQEAITGELGWWSMLCDELDQKNREGIIYNCVFDYCTVEQWSKAIVKSESKDLCGLVRHFRNVKKDLADPARAGELALQLEKDIAELPAPVDKIRKYNIDNLIEILKQPAK